MGKYSAVVVFLETVYKGGDVRLEVKEVSRARFVESEGISNGSVLGGLQSVKVCFACPRFPAGSCVFEDRSNESQVESAQGAGFFSPILIGNAADDVISSRRLGANGFDVFAESEFVVDNNSKKLVVVCVPEGYVVNNDLRVCVTFRCTGRYCHGFTLFEIDVHLPFQCPFSDLSCLLPHFLLRVLVIFVADPYRRIVS